MLLAIAIVALIGSVADYITKIFDVRRGNDFIHIVTVMAWWPICTWFAITWMCISIVLLVIAALVAD
jgi:hypothetical protein